MELSLLLSNQGRSSRRSYLICYPSCKNEVIGSMNKTTRAIPKILSFKGTNYFSHTCEWRIAKTIFKSGKYFIIVYQKRLFFAANMSNISFVFNIFIYLHILSSSYCTRHTLPPIQPFLVCIDKPQTPLSKLAHHRQGN